MTYTSTTTRAASAEGALVHLHAGQIFASAAPYTIALVLGSSVAVCVTDAASHAGGACHYALPLQVVAGPPSARFGNVAIDALLRSMLALGSRERDLVVRVFGGAVTPGPTGRPDTESVGWHNAEVARRALASRGIAIAVEDVGGDQGRRVRFRTDDGRASTRRL